MVESVSTLNRDQKLGLKYISALLTGQMSFQDRETAEKFTGVRRTRDEVKAIQAADRAAGIRTDFSTIDLAPEDNPLSKAATSYGGQRTAPLNPFLAQAYQNLGNVNTSYVAPGVDQALQRLISGQYSQLNPNNQNALLSALSGNSRFNMSPDQQAAQSRLLGGDFSVNQEGIQNQLLGGARTYSPVNPQEVLYQILQGNPAYTGQNAGLENQRLSNQGNFQTATGVDYNPTPGQSTANYQGQAVDLTPQGAEEAAAYRKLLSGDPSYTADLSDVVTGENFKKSVAAPLLRTFDQEIAPRISDAFAGSGASFSSRRGLETRQALEGLNTQMTAEQTRLLQNNMQLEAQLNAQLHDSAAGRQAGLVSQLVGLRGQLGDNENSRQLQLALANAQFGEANRDRALQAFGINSNNELNYLQMQAQAGDAEAQRRLQLLEGNRGSAENAANRQSDLAALLSNQNFSGSESALGRQTSLVQQLNDLENLSRGRSADLVSLLTGQAFGAGENAAGRQLEAANSIGQRDLTNYLAAQDRVLQASGLSDSFQNNIFNRTAQATSVFNNLQTYDQQKANTDFNEFLRLAPENSPWIQLALQTAGVQTKGFVASEQDSSPWGAVGSIGGAIIGSIIPGIGTAAGAAIGGMAGTAVDVGRSF